jgi:hypothetical protein
MLLLYEKICSPGLPEKYKLENAIQHVDDRAFAYSGTLNVIFQFSVTQQLNTNTFIIKIGNSLVTRCAHYGKYDYLACHKFSKVL